MSHLNQNMKEKQEQGGLKRCVCVSERERETDRQTETERQRQREAESFLEAGALADVEREKHEDVSS